MPRSSRYVVCVVMRGFKEGDVRSPTRGFLSPLAPLAVLGLAVVLGGCASGARERHLANRADVVSDREGDGSTRLAIWPGRTPNAAFAALDSVRLSDAGDRIVPR
jgi:hypothetical protein